MVSNERSGDMTCEGYSVSALMGIRNASEDLGEGYYVIYTSYAVYEFTVDDYIDGEYFSDTVSVL